MNKHLPVLFPLLLLCSLFSAQVKAQTILSQGDIAVIGVNTNNNACSAISTEDKINFVCFKPITTGTQICITDCAYLSASNAWKENEGLVCVTYTGAATIAAGTILTFSSSGISPVASPNNPYAGVYPSSAMPYSMSPSTWSISCPTPPFVSGTSFNVAMNMNNGGDQIYFMQGGTWNNPAGADNTTYPAANILYGFSSTATPGFVSGAPLGTQQSNLVPGMECNVMAPSAATDFSYFVPPVPAPTSQAGWIAAISNTANWVSSAGCSAYNTGFSTQYPAGTLFTGAITPGLLTDIADVNLCGTTPYTNYNLTQHNAAIIGSAGYASSEIYWYTLDPSQGTNASTSIIASPTTYSINTSPITLYAAQASSGALSTTRRCNLVAITFTVNPYPSLTALPGTRCFGNPTLLSPITVNNPGGYTVSWYAGPVGGGTLSVGNTYTPSPLPSVNTTYYAEVISNGCATRVPVPLYMTTCVSNCQATDLDSIPVTCHNGNDGQAVVNFEPQLPPSIYFTPNVSATLPLTGGHSYTWSNAGTTNPLTGLSPGTYTVTVAGSGTIKSMPIASGDTWTFTTTAGQVGMPQTSNGSVPNTWSLDGAEPGIAPSAAPAGCATSLAPADFTLNVSTNPNLANPAIYNYGANNTTSVAAISPTIDLTGWSGGSGTGPSLEFDYAEVEETAPVAKGDNMTVYYSPDNGVNWFFLSDPSSTYDIACVASKALWSTWVVNLPVTANNNPNVKIAFVWQNNNNNKWGINLGPGTSSFSAAVNNLVIKHQCSYVPSSVTIPNPVEIIPTISAPATDFCLNATAPTLTTSVVPGTAPLSGTYSYAWSTGGATSSITAPTNAVGTTTYTVSVTHTYTVTITAVNGSTSTAVRTCVVTDDIAITIHDLPTLDLGADVIACNNNGVGANITLDAGAGYGYLWSTTATTQTINPTTTNTYTVTITDGNSCTATDAISVSLNQPPNVTPADLSVTNVTNCALANGEIAFPSPAGVTVETGSGFATAGTDVTGTSPLTGLGVGAYTLVYTNNATGCYTEVTVNVGSATALPPTPVINPLTSTICINGTIPTFTASPNGGGGPAWQWYGPDNSATLIAGATNANYTPTGAQVDVSAPNTYTFYVTNTVLGCESLPASVVLTIQDAPNPGIVALPSSTVCSGSALTLDADNIAGATYAWSNGGGSNSSATFNPTNVTAAPTSVTYTVTVTDGVCIVPTSITITVNPNPVAGVLTPSQSICSLANGSIAFTNPSGGNVYYSSGTSYNSITGVDVTGASPITALTSGDYTFHFENPTTNCYTEVSTNIGNTNTITAPSVTPLSPICYTGVATSNPALTASGSIGTYQWYGPNNAATVIAGETGASYAPSVVGSISAATSYTYYVSSVVGACESSKTPITFTINPLPVPSINGNDVLCNGTSSNTLSVSPAFSSYLWNDGSNGASISNAIANNTNYAVTVTDGNGCQSATNVTVLVNNAVAVAITPAAISVCSGGAIAFDAGAGFASYAWSNGGGSSQTTTYSNITSNTSYVVTVSSVQNGVSCEGTATASVTVNPNPNLSATAFQTLNVCSGAAVNLLAVPYTNGGASGSQFYTDYNGDPVMSPSNAIVPTTPGQYIYVLTETVGATACSDTLQIRVNVNPAPSISLTPASTSICLGASFDLSSLTVNDANSTVGTVTYHSTTPAVAGNQLPGTTVSPTTNTTYYIKKTVGSCFDEEPFTITINPLPLPSIGGTTAVCSGSSTTLTASSSSSYLWDNGSTNAGITVSPTANTTYTVTVTNGNNCASSTTVSVTVNAPLSLSNQQTVCNLAGTQYTVSFDISGTGPFSVTGVAGTVTGNNFVSNPIPIASTPTISISSTATGACPAISYTPAPACTVPSSCTTTTGCFGNNLVVDGGFETFNPATPLANFASNYDYSPCPGTICTNGATGAPILCQYDFSVQTSPNPCNTDFSSNLNDHTTGSGNMMIVDFPAGNVAPNNRIWCQTVTLAANTNYCFGAYFINILPTGTGLPNPSLGLLANGTLLGTVSVPETEQWQSASYQFNSGLGGNYVLCITNENFGAVGYDVAIDDIYIRPVTTGTPATAVDDVASICQGQASQLINVLSNDTAGSNPIATLTIITPPPFTDGEITNINFATGTVTFAPFVGFSGTTSFQYQICDAAGCCDIATVTITQNALPTASINGTNTICNGQSTTLTATNGTNYLWSTGDTTAPISVSPTANTTYTVTVSDANNCSATTSATVTVNPLPVATLATTNNTACTLANYNGGVDLTVTSGGTHTFLWSNGATTEDLSAINGASYTVTITNTLTGCTATTTAVITDNTSSPVATLATTNNTACTVANYNGGVNLTVTSGGTHTFLWSNGATTEDLSAINGASYTVTITNTLTGCTATTTAVITDNTSSPVATLATTNNTACTVANYNGGVNLTVTSGGTHTFLWSNGATTEDLSAINGASYTVTITNTLTGCTATTTATVNDNVALPTPSIAIAETSGTVNDGTLCVGSSLSLNASGGGTYTWTFPNGTTSATNPTNIASVASSNGGIYTVVVTAANGCTASSTTTITINNNPAATATITETSGTPNNNAVCLGAAASIAATGGNSYAWTLPSGGTSSSNPINITAATATDGGIYTVTVTDNNSCTATTVVTLTTNALPIAVINPVSPFCATASASLSASGGVSYAWAGTGITIPTNNPQNLSGLAANTYTYTVTVSDVNACSATASTTVTVNSTPTATATATPAAICSGDNTSLLATGGTTYTWDIGGPNPNTVAPTTTTTYTVTVSDANACSSIATTTVTVNPLPTLSATSSCGANPFNGSGSVTVTASVIGGGTLEYSTDGTNFQSSNVFNGLSNGSYTITVRVVGTNCINTTVVAVSCACTAPTLTINQPAAICQNAAANATVDLSSTIASNTGTAPTYYTTQALANAGGPGDVATPTAVATSGTYYIRVNNPADATCSDIEPVTVTINSLPTATATPSLNTACFAPFDGTIDLSVTSGGAYDFAWSNAATTEDLNNVGNGTYTVTITNAATNCSTTVSATVNNNTAAPTATVTTSDNTACSAAAYDGGVNLTVSSAGTHTFVWSNAATTEDLNNVGNGTYTVTITNATTNCSTTVSATVNNNTAAPTATVTTSDNTACSAAAYDGGVNLTVISGGTHTFVWSNAATTEDLNNVGNGTYTVTITNATTNCSTTVSATVNNNTAAPTATVTTSDNTACSAAAYDGGVNLTVISGGTHTFVWSSAATTEDLNNVGNGTYTVTITNATTNCSTTVSATVNNNTAAPTATVTTSDNTACSAAAYDGGVDLTVSSAGTHTFVWSNAATTEDLNNVGNGTYTVTITNATTNCSTTVSATVNNNPNLPTPSIAVVETSGTPNDGTLCEGSALSLTASGGNSYTWTLPNSSTSSSNPISTVSATTANGGTYAVVATAANGCAASTTTTITVNALPVASITISETSGIANNNAVCIGDAATISVSGGGTYAWTLPDASSSSSNPIVIAASTANDGGTYTVTVTNNGCTNTATVNLTVNALPTASITGITSFCETGSTTLTAAGGTTYTWSGSGISNPSTNPQALSGLGVGSYTYNLTVTDVNSCSATTTTTVDVNANPNLTITGSTTFCLGGTTVLDAGSFNTYLWSEGSTTATITVNTAGTYTVTVSDTNGCSAIDSQIVSQSNSLNPSIGGVNQVCAGNTTTLDAGSFNTYLWSNGSTTATINVGVGTYSVTVTDISGCSGTSSMNVTNFNPSATASVVGSPACPGDVVTLNASVGNAYSWSGPAGYSNNTQSPSISIPNNTTPNNYTYTVIVTDNNGCTASATVDVVVSPLPTPTIVGNTPICDGSAVTLTASGGNTYNWNDPANTTGAILTATPTTTTTYTVTVTNIQACSATTSTTVNVTTTPIAAIAGNTPICNGSAVTLVASGGNSYLWSDAGNTNTASLNVSPSVNTTYTVTVTSANALCTDTETVTVVVNNLPNAVAGGGGNVCTNSGINLTASGGSSYQWSGPNAFSSNQQNPSITAATTAATGIYTVVVSDGNNCDATATVSIVVADCSCPNPPTISALPTAQICAGQTAALSATIGGAATTATWTTSGSGTFNNSTGTSVVYTPSVADIAAANVTITIATDDPDGGGTLCAAATTNIILSINALPTATIGGNSSICNGNSVTLTATGGSSYLWDDVNATNNSILTVAPTTNTTYTVIVTNANNCSTTASHVVNVNAAPIANITGDNSICENESTTLSATGGNSYLWNGTGISNPSNGSQTFSGLTPNTYTYTVTVTNVANCSTIINTTLTVSANPIAAISGITSFCENGSTNLTASGNGTYTWSGATVTNPSQSTQTVSGLSNGSYPYSVTVTDSNGCSDTESLTVTVNALPTPTISGSTTFCVDTDLDAGANYDSYVWSSGNQTTQSITVNFSDTYTVTVTDNGCTTTTSIVVTQAANLTPTINGNTNICAGGNTILTTASFATYEWTGGETTQSITVNATGTYTVTVTDASGCSGTASETISQINISPFSAGQDDLVCSYTYQLNSTGTTGSWSVVSGNATFTNANATTTNVDVTTCGIYEFVWTENNGACTATDTVKIGFIQSVPANSCPPETENTCGFSVDITPASVVGAACLPNGACSAGSQLWQDMVDELNLNCTTPPSNCHWEWDYLDGVSTGIVVTFTPDEFTPSVTATANTPGNYRFRWVCDTDPNCPALACGGTNTDKIFNFVAPLTVSANSFCIGGVSTDYIVTLSITGGEAPYTYPDGFSETFASGVPFNYVVDDNSICPPALVNGSQVCNPSCPTITPTISGTTTICEGNSTTLTAQNGFAAYVWSTGVTSDNIAASANGVYTVTVTDNNGCTGLATATVTVNQPTLPTFAPIAAICSGDVAPVLPTTALNGISGTWSPAVSNTNSGTYTFTPDAGQCATTTIIDITVNQLPVISASQNCTGATADVTVTVVSGNPTSFALDGVIGVSPFVGVVNGTHTLVATDANGCSGSVDIVVNCIPGCPTINVTGDAALCAGSSATYTQNGGVAGGAWSVLPANAGTIDANGVFTSSASFTGNATLTYTDNSTGQNCTGSLVVAVNAATLPTFAPIAAICSGATAPVLPTTALNGISGTWLPAVSNTNSGTYTFTPDAGECATTTTLDVTVNQPTLPTFTPIAAICSGATAPVLPTTALNGISGTWSPAVSNTNSGTYTFTPDAGQCVTTTTIDITVNELPVISASQNCTGATADVTVTVVSGNPTSFALDGVVGTSPFSGVTNGTHTLVATDANGCSGSVDVVVSCIPGCPTINVTGDAALCAGTSVTYTQNGGSPIGFWEMSPANAGNIDNTGLLNVNNNFTGNITVTYTDNSTGQNCTGSLVVAVNAVPTASISGNIPICAGGNGIVLDAGIHDSYQWSNALGNGQTATVSAGGTYTVTVTDNTCSTTAQVVVNESLAIAINPTVVNVGCSGGATGSINLQVNGGVGTYDFAWNAALPNQQNQFGLSANTYTVTVTDDNNCTATASAVVTEPANPLTISLVATNVSCNGANDGSIATTVNFGTNPLSFVWNNGIGATEDPIDLAPNTYNVTVTDGNGCSASADIVIGQPTALTLTIGTTDANCGQSNGSAIATALGGTGTNYVYVWGTPNGTGNNLMAGGYAVTVTDNNNCSTTQAFAIGNTEGPVVDSETLVNATCGNSNGAISISASSSAGGITYQWSANANAGNTGVVNNLAADSYTVTISDTNNNCPQVVVYTITDSPSPTVSVNDVTNASCGNNNGSITVNVVGGTGTMDYVWSVAGNTNSIGNLGAGTYSVTVTDDNNCTATLSQAITQSNSPSITNINTVGANCNNSNGSISFDNIVGASYTWLPVVSNSNTATNLASGDYQVTVTLNGCSTNTTISVASLGGVTIDAIDSTPTSCGLANGSAVVATTGANNVTYNWTGGNTNNPATNLAAATYTVTVTDDNGCSTTASVVVAASSNPQITNGTVTDASCGNDNASVVIEVSGGTIPYTYDWSNSPSTSETATDLAVGTYTVTVTDNSNCTTTAIYTIASIQGVQIDGVNTNSAACGQSNGDATIIATGSGLTYQWNTPNGNGNTATNLAAGAYEVTITDSNACSVVEAIDISNIGAPTISIVNTSNATCGNDNGSITIAAIGGTGTLTYQWSTANGAGTNATNLAGGTYTVTVSDGNNCEAVESFVIDNAAAPLITTDDVNAATCGNDNGSISILANGGTGTLTYQWSTANGTGTNATNLAGGTYTVTATDQNSCATTLEVIVTSTNAPVVNIVGDENICEGETTTLATDATFTTYAWSTGFGTATTDISSNGVYTVTVTDANACTATDNIEVSVTIFLPLDILGNTNICEGETTTLDVGPGFDAYLWSSNGETTQAIEVGPGTYTVTVTDNGCTTMNSITVSATPLPSNVSATHTCVDAATATVTVTATGNNLEYALDNGFFQSSNVFNNVANGAHVIEVHVSGTACSVTTNLSFNCACANPPTLTVHDLSICNGTSADLATAIDNNTAGAPTYYDNAADANSGAATGIVADPSNVGAGTYFIRVVDVANPLCFTVESVTVSTNNIAAVSVSGLNNPYCIDETPDALIATTAAGASLAWYSDAALTTLVGSDESFTPPTSNTAGTFAYWVVQSLNGCNSEAVEVDVVFELCTAPCNLTAPIGVTTELSVCEGIVNAAAFSVSNNNVGATVHWYDAAGNEVATGNTFVPTAIGSYTVQVVSDTDPTCISSSITAILTEIANDLTLNAGDDVVICEGENVNLIGTTTASDQVTWSSASGVLSSPNTLQTTYTPTGTGVFSVVLTAENACASSSDTLIVTVNPNVNISVSGDFNIVLGQSTQLTATGAASYVWGNAATLSCDDCANPIATPTETTSYNVASADACSEVVEVTVVVVEGEPTLVVPTAFSPNNDDVNDVFNVIPKNGVIENYYITIWNRWGNCIFESDNIAEGWDGTYKGIDQELEVYVYTIKYNFVGEQQKFYSGNVTLVR